MSEESDYRPSTSPAFFPHLPSRQHGIPEDNLTSATNHPQHRMVLNVHQQRLYSDRPISGDSGQLIVVGNPLQSPQPSRVLHERSYVKDPSSPVSPVFDDPSRRSRMSTLSQPQLQLDRFTDDGPFASRPSPTLSHHRHQLHGIGHGDLDSDQDVFRRPVPLRTAPDGRGSEQAAERGFPASPISDASASNYAHHLSQSPAPAPLQRGQEVTAARPRTSNDSDVLPPKAQRRRIKSPTSDDRPRKKQRPAKPTAETEPVARYDAKEHSQVSDVATHRDFPATILMPAGNEIQSCSLQRSPKGDEVQPPLANDLPGDHHNRRRSKSRIADLLNAEQPAEEPLKPFQPTATAQSTDPTKMGDASEAPLENTIHIESAREEENDRPQVTAKKQNSQEQDPHEWLLEHYADSPTPNSGTVTPSAIISAPPHGDVPPLLTRPPDALAPFEQELEEAAGILAPRAGNDNNIDADIDVVTELVVESLEGADNRPITALMDVEDELLSLVGDRPVVPHPSRHLPSAPSPLSQQHPSPDQSGSDRRGIVQSDSRHASPAVPAIPFPSPPSNTSLAIDVHPLDASSAPTPIVERGSMPPPAATTVGGSGSSRKGELTGGKKKEKIAKVHLHTLVIHDIARFSLLFQSAPKAKPPPKPRAKPAPKAKTKVISDAPGSGPTAKGAKAATLTATAVPPAVKKSISAGASRSRSTSVMPRGSAGPEGELEAGADDVAAGEDDGNTEDDKLYCVCKTKYDEDRVMIACDRCALATPMMCAPRG